MGRTKDKLSYWNILRFSLSGGARFVDSGQDKIFAIVRVHSQATAQEILFKSLFCGASFTEPIADQRKNKSVKTKRTSEMS